MTIHELAKSLLVLPPDAKVIEVHISDSTDKSNGLGEYQIVYVPNEDPSSLYTSYIG